jgi:hypothetical protein
MTRLSCDRRKSGEIFGPGFWEWSRTILKKIARDPPLLADIAALSSGDEKRAAGTRDLGGAIKRFHGAPNAPDQS